MKHKIAQFKNQLKLLLLKKIWGKFGIKVILLLLVLFGGYYIFFLAPKLALPNAYLKAQEVFAQHRANLVQNRVALVELARLSADSSDLFNKEAELLQKLQQTNTEGVQSLEKNKKLPYVAGTPNELLDFLNNDLPAALFPLLLKEREILEEQQSIIAALIELIKKYPTSKEKVLAAQFALIRSDASVKLLTRLTNLILEYDFWLKQISIYQAKLAAKK